jgi:hypothetical protein
MSMSQPQTLRDTILSSTLDASLKQVLTRLVPEDAYFYAGDHRAGLGQGWECDYIRVGQAMGYYQGVNVMAPNFSGVGSVGGCIPQVDEVFDLFFRE